MMRREKRFVRLAWAGAFRLSLTACAPKVGSDRWCTDMKKKEKGEWTVNEAADFAEHCVFK